ncbi:hypothetical protein CUMW_277550 [Citrus unshiu]|uniref:Uncharacterized protein n=1 Tax=Citrus unshiu TaxID=55188 RepID=A0A2H5N3X8_CITUN|nr:hypothetical protein CUMW_277550 [Citrus unshiu]
MSSALEIVKSPPDSTFAAFTLRSSTKRANLLDRVPSPFSLRSSSSPKAWVYFAEPSARNFMLLFSGNVLAHAFITNGSLTLMQRISSTPFDFNSSPFSMNPGTCFKLQVGVKAPGTPKRMTFLPAASECMDTYCN